MRCSTFSATILSAGTGLLMGLSADYGSLAWAQTQPTIADANVTADTIVAVVDEKPVTLGELIVFRQSLPASFQVLPDEVLLESLIKMIVDQQILANAAEAANLQRSKRTNFALKNTRRSVLANVYVEEAVRSAVTEDSIAAAYAEKFVNTPPAIQIRAAHILVDDQALADDLRKKLIEGVAFSSLAAEFGNDLTSTRGGDLGWQEAADLLPAFADAVAEMEPGQIKGPVRSAFGWHIIRLDARRAKPVPSLDEMRESLRRDLEGEIRKIAISNAEEAAIIKILTDAVPAAAIRDDALILP